MIPSFKEKGKKTYTLTSIGAPKDGKLPMDTLLFNICYKLTRRANAIKVIGYLIWHERSRLNFQVSGSHLKRFCNLGSSPDQAFADLEASGFVEYNESSIIIRYDKLLKE